MNLEDLTTQINDMSDEELHEELRMARERLRVRKEGERKTRKAATDGIKVERVKKVELNEAQKKALAELGDDDI